MALKKKDAAKRKGLMMQLLYSKSTSEEELEASHPK